MSILGTLAACDDGPTAPPETPPVKLEDELTFVRFPPELLSRIEREGSVWAVRGENRELVLNYLPEAGEEEGEEFLEFDIPGEALLRRPDGAAFAEGDSILITISVATDGRFLFDFQPSGLIFDPDHPAELEVTYRRAEGDLNGDGSVDGEDDELERELSIWKQEAEGQPWIRVGSATFELNDEIEADIFGFTGFCVAA
ncbi:MAG: hypothetical protein ACRELV_10570 [Longimicrobiales bacterium]